MLLIQFQQEKKRMVGILDETGKHVYKIDKIERLYDLVMLAINLEITLKDVILKYATNEKFEYEALLAANNVLLPIDHYDNAHCLVSGTGLTHINSALLRKDIHDNNFSNDIQKIYHEGLENGKPSLGAVGARPEWFFKGTGFSLKSTGENLNIPAFALGCGEEAEIVAIYVISPNDGKPFRIGFAIGNEFSDHLLEKRNRFYVAQSKMMPCSIGPEIFIGDLPKKITGLIKIIRSGSVFWQADFQTGAEQMTHSLENIENYLFQNEFYKQPGNVHYHFLGADKISFADSIVLIENDIIEIGVSGFNKPLINKIKKVIKSEYHVCEKL